MVNLVQLEQFKTSCSILDKFVKKYTKLGWFMLLLPFELSSKIDELDSSNEIIFWIKHNIQGRTKNFAYIWFFEKQEDAVVFKLRWL